VIQDDSRSSSPSPTMNFDYLYEFSETRKVLEEFFKSGAENQDNQQLQFQVYNNIYIYFYDINYNVFNLSLYLIFVEKVKLFWVIHKICSLPFFSKNLIQ